MGWGKGILEETRQTIIQTQEVEKISYLKTGGQNGSADTSPRFTLPHKKRSLVAGA